jgi:hypothetical protein
MAAAVDFRSLSDAYEKTFSEAEETQLWEDLKKAERELMAAFRITDKTAVSFAPAAYHSFFQSEEAFQKVQKLFVKWSGSVPDAIDAEALEIVPQYETLYLASLKDDSIVAARKAKHAFKDAVMAYFKASTTHTPHDFPALSEMGQEKAFYWYDKYLRTALKG